MNKTLVHEELLRLVQLKKNELSTMIDDLRKSNNETKSSMGDKYETSREIIQQEINRILNQLKLVDDQINTLTYLPSKNFDKIQHGSLIETTTGYFYISISYGKFTFDNHSIFAISEHSPMAKEIVGLKVGDNFTINSSSVAIKNIW